MNPRYAQWFSQMKEDLLFFGQKVNPAMFTASSPQFHRQLSELYLDKELRQVNIIAPRHSAKTSILGNAAPLHHISVDAMRHWNRDPDPRFVLVISKSLEPHALNVIEDIKMVLEARWFKGLFGDWGEATARQWRTDQIMLKNGTTILARGMGTQVRGLKRNNIRPTFILLDDPEDEANTKTPRAMEENLRTLLQGLVPALREPDGRIFLVGTPQNARSMVMELKKATDWKTLHITCWKKGEEYQTSYWPELWPTERLMERKNGLESIGRGSVFYREYETKIVGDQNQLVLPENLKWWDGNLVVRGEPGESLAWLEITHLGLKALPTSHIVPVNIFMGVDPASSTNRRSNYSTIVPIAIDANRNRYILPYYRKRVNTWQLALAVLEFVKTYKPLRTRIETVAFQVALYDTLMQMDERIPGLVAKESPRDRKKAVVGEEEYGRLDGMQPDFARGRYFLKSRETLEGMQDLKDELLLYPFADQDDLLDGLFYAQKGNYLPYHTIDNWDKELPVKKYRVRPAIDWLTV